MGATRTKLTCIAGLFAALLTSNSEAGDPPGNPAVDLSGSTMRCLGDVNGDGIIDMITAAYNFQSPSNEPILSALLGDGLGSFGPPIVTPIAVAPEVTLIADFDADGRDDILVADQVVQAYLSVGDGTFAAPIDIPDALIGQGRRLAVGDFDGNGAADVVSSFSGASEFRVHVSQLGGGFDPAISVAVDGTLRAITMGDVDGGGQDDILVSRSGCVATPGCLPIVVFYAQPGGGVSGPLGISAANSSLLIAHDMNADGLDDLVLRDGGTLVAQRSVGSGPFTPPTPILEGGWSAGSMFTDENRDGLTDLLVYVGSDACVLVTQTALDTYVAGTPYEVEFFADFWSMHAADLDQDGAMDRVLGVDDQAVIAFGAGDSSMRNGWFGEAIGPLQIADLDGDGRADVLSGHDARVARGRPGGRLGAFESLGFDDPANQAAPWIHAADFNGDGLLDVATTRLDAQAAPGTAVAGPPLFVNLASSPAVFTDDPSPLPMPADESLLGVGVADLDNDGDPDVIRHGQRTDISLESLRTALNDGAGTLTDTFIVHMPPLSNPSGVTGLHVADLDGDGALDVLLASSTSFSMRSALNLGRGQFGIPLLATADAATEILTPVALADSDGDGVLDINAVGNHGTEILQYRGLGDGTFELGVTSDTDLPFTTLTSLLAGDIDHDGDVDLVGQGEGVFSYLGDGQGSFETGEVLRALGYPLIDNRAGALGDVNGDGAVDIVHTGPMAMVLYGNGAWQQLGASLAGPAGHSRLSGAGPLTPGSQVEWLVEFAPPSTPGLLVLGLSDLSAPFKGGTLVPFPDVLAPVSTDAHGELLILAAWPAGGLPSGFQLWSQVWFTGGTPSATTALLATVP